nr:hypothetical protein Iba_chr12bCG14500 [Ipomoea batatas]
MVVSQRLWKSMSCSLIPTMTASFIRGKLIEVVFTFIQIHSFHSFLNQQVT